MNSATASRNPSETLFATPAIVAGRRDDGSIVVRSTTPLQAGVRCIGDWLEHWARQAPERIFLADRARLEQRDHALELVEILGHQRIGRRDRG